VILAAGSGEANAGAFLGYAFSIGTLGAAGIGLACAALARPSTAVRGVGAVAGLALAMPAVISGFWASVGSVAGVLSLGVGALCFATASSLAGAAVTAREAHPADVAAALCGTGLAALGLVASFGAPFAELSYQSGRAVASVDPVMRAAILAQADAIAAHLQSAGQWGIPLAFLPVVGLLFAGASSGRLTRVSFAPVGLVAALIALCLWQRAAAEAVVPRLAQELLKLPWADQVGFEPVSPCAEGPDRAVEAMVTPDFWQAIGEAPISLAEPDARLTEAMSRVLSKERERHLPKRFAKAVVPKQDVERSPSLTLAIDRRVSGRTLQRIIRIAGEVGAHSIILAGLSQAPVPELPSRPPVLAIARMASPLGFSLPIHLTSALADGVPERDEVLWHGRLGSDPLRMAARRGADEKPFDASGEGGKEGPTGLAYLEVTAEADAERLARAVDGLGRHGLYTVAVVGALPGHPDQTMADGEAPVPMSDIDKEAIHRVVVRHRHEVRACYQQALARSQTLAGKVVFEFEILPDGRVGDHHVKGSGLKDPEMEECLDAVLAAWRFPPHAGSAAKVSYPFVFGVADK
jgi:hypothetical protein